jgi:DNA-directed RNA polymerase subunit omega
MRDDYLAAALKIIDDPNILVNVVSRRVKQLKRGNRALIDSLEKLLPEDVALREIIEGKISYELPPPETLAETEYRERSEREHYRFRKAQNATSPKPIPTLAA